MADAILVAKKITKSFFGVQVLKGIDFEVRAGEVMGIVGENGAGKSTLMKIITGLYTNDGGEIVFEGKSMKFSDPGMARDAGISIIHQEFNQFAHLSVAENIFLDRKDYRNKFGKVNWKKMYQDAEKVLGDLGAHFDVSMPVKMLSVREQQLVEIAKAVSSNAKVLIMDEPSAALPDNEVQNMFDVVKVLKKRGVGIIYISHRMKEIEQICDRVTILRDGVNEGVVEMSAGVIDEVIARMIGREIKDYYPHSKRKIGDVLLKCDGITGSGLKNVSLTVSKGEILGLYGLAGSGSTELAEMIMGLRPIVSGTVEKDGKKIKAESISESMNAGIGYVPSDRRREGIIVNLPIDQNTILANLEEYSAHPIINSKHVNERVQKLIADLRIKCVDQNQQVLRLSGGNQQKVVLAKWLDRNPTLLIMNEPTRGVDVGAKSEIYKLMDELANSGIGILLISSEVPEVLGVCDRIVVMSRGRITGEFQNEELGQDVLLKSASETGKGDEAE